MCIVFGSKIPNIIDIISIKRFISLISICTVRFRIPSEIPNEMVFWTWAVILYRLLLLLLIYCFSPFLYIRTQSSTVLMKKYVFVRFTQTHRLFWDYITQRSRVRTFNAIRLV